jgi:hypothetical protein
MITKLTLEEPVNLFNWILTVKHDHFKGNVLIIASFFITKPKS